MEKFLKLLSEEQSLSGGTSLITMYIPPNGKMSISTQKLNSEYGLESKAVQKDIKIALKSALYQMSLYKEARAPEHGFLLCTGVVSGTCHIDDAWTYKGAILLEPEAVLQKAQYICGKTFPFELTLNSTIKRNLLKTQQLIKNSFDCKQIHDYSHMIITNESKYQSLNMGSEIKTKIICSKQLYRYGDMTITLYY